MSRAKKANAVQVETRTGPAGEDFAFPGAVRECQEFEHLVAELSSHFINILPREVDGEIEHGLKKIVEALGADRSALYQYAPEAARFVRTHQHTAPGIEGLPAGISGARLPWFRERIVSGCAVAVSRLGDLPAAAAAEKAYLAEAGLKSMAAVPLRAGGEILGALSVASVRKEREWPVDLLQRLGLLGEIFANALARKRAQREIDDRLTFETLIADLSGKLLNLPPNKVDGVIEEGLGALGRFFGSDQARLFQYLPAVRRFEATHRWFADGKAWETKTAERLDTAQLPNLTSRLKKEGSFVAGSLADLPESWTEEREFFRLRGAKAGAIVGLRLRGLFVGGISIGCFRSERTWPDGLVQRLKFVGEIFAKALRCKQSEESLHEAFDEIARLKEQLQAENVYLREEIKLQHNHDEIVGNSRAIRDVLRQIEQAAPTGSTILICGETGTGKELLARAIHNLSPRKARAMVKVNCAAMPATLVESELFGREKGSYTGALTRQAGRFEVADGGTIFLDEVGELSPEVQAKLLRVLQEGQFERLGSTATITVDVRVVAATNKDLERAVAGGAFREDLYYRLNVFPITIPPLRARADDIEPLVWTFVKELGERMGKNVASIPRRDLERLKAYAWPGNVRELRNLVERAMILCTGPSLHIEIPAPRPGAKPAGTTLEEVERRHITAILEAAGWRIRGAGGAAATLGLKATTLEARMRRLGIRRPGRSPT